MYSVLQIAGHQYWVQTGDIIDVQKLDAEPGSTIQLDQVLFVSGDNPAVGTPSGGQGQSQCTSGQAGKRQQDDGF